MPYHHYASLIQFLGGRYLLFLEMVLLLQPELSETADLLMITPKIQNKNNSLPFAECAVSYKQDC